MRLIKLTAPMGTAVLKKFDKRKANSSIIKRHVNQGYSIGKMIVSIWNFQENPPKLYPFGRRIHHGEIGIVGLVISSLMSNPRAIGFFRALIDDDLPDKDEWFIFEKITDRKKFS